MSGYYTLIRIIEAIVFLVAAFVVAVYIMSL